MLVYSSTSKRKHLPTRQRGSSDQNITMYPDVIFVSQYVTLLDILKHQDLQRRLYNCDQEKVSLVSSNIASFLFY